MITNTNYLPDLREVINLFVPDDTINVEHEFTQKDGKYFNKITVNGKLYDYVDCIPQANGEMEVKRYEKRNVKLCLYRALESYYGKSMPWGALTGIRPTKLAYASIERTGDFYGLFEDMGVSKEKVKLVSSILEEQKGIYEKNVDNADFFVFIPFCTSRCKYCSFVTTDISKSGKYVHEYVDTLVKEIEYSKSLVKNLRSVYIGGGTPVSLPKEELKRVLDAIGKVDVEYTVEAGRPDCIDEENVKLLLDYGVNRICVNPQTFNDKTLERLGRRHTAKDIFDKYALVKDKFIVNMDLIAGLEGESFDDFKYSLDTAVSLKPDNITVHTLCLKKGAELKENVTRLDDNGVSQMVEYSHKTLDEHGYKPYYMYRQKYMAGNQENTGYALKGKACVYNIDIMEEISGNVACGANAVSKAVFDNCNRIERYKNPKDIPTYINKLPTILEEKKKLFQR